MHIAVVTTNVADRKQTERLLGRANQALANEIGTLYIDSFGDDTSFLHACMKYDLFLLDFVDIQHSYEIYDTLKEKDVPGIVVFCLNTASDAPAKTYPEDEIFTIPKPLLTNDLHALLRKISQKLMDKKASHCLIEIRSEAGTRYIEKNEILYARYHEREHQVQYHFASGETLLYSGPIDDIYRCLGAYPEFEIRFKIYIINKTHMVSEDKKSVTMSNGDVLKKPLFTNPLTGIL